MKKKFGILFLLILVIGLMGGCKPGLEQKTGVVVENVVLESKNNLVSFNIQNFDNFIVDCYARVILNDRLVALRNIGVIEPKSEEKKQINLGVTNTNAQIKIEPVCMEVNSLTVQKCGDLEEYIDRRICELEPENPGVKQCYAKKTLSEKMFCMALITNNPEICRRMLTSRKYWCTAYITGDFSQCENIIDINGKDRCYMDIGMNRRDKNICEKINDQAKKTSCMAAVSLDADACLKGSQIDEMSCILIIAEVTGDKTLCEKLTDSKEECYHSLEE